MPATIPMAGTLLVPLTGAALTFLVPRRAVGIGLAAAFATAACVIGLLTEVLEHGVATMAVGGWTAPLGIGLRVDGLSALMLTLTAVVGAAISIYAVGYFEAGTRARLFFWPGWLFAWSGLNALYLSADLFNIYVTLEIIGISAVGLTALGGNRAALSAALRYLLVGLLGSLLYLLAVVLIYADHGVLDLDLVRAGLRPGPLAWISLGLLTSGLLLKNALFPMHFWLPLAHGSAPAPVSALLSALVVKASFYLLLRLWFEVYVEVITPAGATVVGVLGGMAVLWGSVLALRQERLKLLVAYSTVAQLGYLFLAFPVVVAAGFSAWSACIYFAVSHGVAKAAMFLSVGTLMHHAGHDRIRDLGPAMQRLPLTMLAFGLAGMSIIGLPPSGGFVAKWLLLEAALRSGPWWVAVVLLIGGVLAAAYLLKAISGAFTVTTDVTAYRAPRTMQWTTFGLALIVIAMGLFATGPLGLLVDGAPGDLSPIARAGSAP